MKIISLNPILAELSPKKFESWFKKRFPEVGKDWGKYYENIGGKIPKKTD